MDFHDFLTLFLANAVAFSEAIFCHESPRFCQDSGRNRHAAVVVVLVVVLAVIGVFDVVIIPVVVMLEKNLAVIGVVDVVVIPVVVMLEKNLFRMLQHKNSHPPEQHEEKLHFQSVHLWCVHTEAKPSEMLPRCDL